MKKTTVALILTVTVSILLVSCVLNQGEINMENSGGINVNLDVTNRVVTDEQGSTVTDEQGNPETYPPETNEDTTAGETGTGHINNAGANTDDSFGELIPVG